MSRSIEDKTLDLAMVEALRFLKAAKALRASRKAARIEAAQKGDYWTPASLVENAACCRASMDLTRALATLRAGK